MGYQHSHEHGYGCRHGHGYLDGAKNKHQRAFLIATSVNLAFVLLEVIYALVANSMSLLADAGHNFGDVLGLALSGVANWLLTKPASDKYSYGYKKISILAAFANAFLLAVTTGIIAYESVLRLYQPLVINEKIIILMASLGILINGGTALLFMKNRQHDLNIKSAFVHLISDALLSLGVVLTVMMIEFTHYLWLDPLVGLVIAMIIFFSTWGLISDSVNLMLDAVPRTLKKTKVQTYLAGLSGVKAVHDLHIWSLSTRQIALTAHLIRPEGLFEDSEQQAIRTALKNQFTIDHITLQIERGDVAYPCIHTETC